MMLPAASNLILAELRARAADRMPFLERWPVTRRLDRLLRNLNRRWRR